MRIIAGKHRGRVLCRFDGEKIRPTPDRVKESLFQILEGRFHGARVLDLFAGSGALGLESMSRGAREAVFCDLDLTLVKKNLSLLKESATLLEGDYATCLKKARGQFDLIFLDPPYQSGVYENALALILKEDKLEKNGLVVVESEREIPFPGYEKTDERFYGRVRIAILRRTT